MLKNIKSLLFSVTLLFLAGCTTQESEASLNPNDYNQSMNFIVENFELEYEPSGALVPDYIKEYDVRNISKDITLAMNASGQVVYIDFNHMMAEDVELVLNNIGLNAEDSEDLTLLLNDVGAFQEEYQSSEVNYDVDNFYFHVLGINDEFLEKMNREEPYILKIFYNENIFNDFINE